MARTTAQQRLFDEAQQDETFLVWVSLNEDVLDLEFDEVDDLPAPPWDAAVLDRAEAAALEIVASERDCFTEETRVASWHLVRFIGHVLIDAFEGHRVNVPGQGGDRRGSVGVDLPFRTLYIEPIGMLTSAMYRRTGTEWSEVFGYAVRDQAKYLQARNKD